MSLARVKSWVAGEVLTATDLNAEFNNLLVNAASLFAPLTANLAAGSFKLTNLGAGTATGDSLRFEQNGPVASQADVAAGTSIAAVVTPGRQHFHPSAARMWCLANFAGTKLASYNCASVNDNGLGDMTFTLSVGIANTQIQVGCGDSGAVGLSWRMRTILQLISQGYASGTPTDGVSASCVVFGT